jgi:tRNA (guanine-N7-)-methyltransferase
MEGLLPKLLNSKANPAHIARVHARLAALRETLRVVIPQDVNRIVWEVGSGHGHLLTRYAGMSSDRFFVGIDILNDRLRKAERKQTAAGVTNLRFIKAEAGEFLACLPARILISEVLILFPDPWPKKRHHKNRLIQAEFLGELACRMASGGRLYFRTDHTPYLDWARERISAHPGWVLVPDAPWVLEEKTVFQARAPAYGSLVAELRTPGPIETQAG